MSHNISLKYVFDPQNLNARQARWLAFLSEYDFEIKHIKGKENKVADASSINAIMNFIASISSYKTEFNDKLEEWIKMDKELEKISTQNGPHKENNKIIAKITK